MVPNRLDAASDTTVALAAEGDKAMGALVSAGHIEVGRRITATLRERIPGLLARLTGS